MKPLKIELSDRLWALRDEIAALKKQRKSLLDPSTMDEHTMKEIHVIDLELDELLWDYENTENALMKMTREEA